MLYLVLHLNELITKGFLQEDIYKDGYPEILDKRRTKRHLRKFTPTDVELFGALDYLIDLDKASDQTRKVLGDMGIT